MARVGKEIIDAIGRLDTCDKSEGEKNPTKELTDLTAKSIFDIQNPKKGARAIDYSNAIGLSPTNDDDGYTLPDTDREGDLTEIFG